MGEQNTTLIIELVVVGMAVAVGLVYLANNWPASDAPLIVSAAGTTLFVVYKVVVMVRARRRPAQAAAEPQQPEQAPVESPQPDQQPKQDVAPQAGADAAASALALGAPSESPTAHFDLDSLRPETDEDLLNSGDSSVPLFASNTMNLSQTALEQGAAQLRAQDGDAAPEHAQPVLDEVEVQPVLDEVEVQPVANDEVDEPQVDEEKTHLTPLHRLKKVVQRDDQPAASPRSGADEEGR